MIPVDQQTPPEDIAGGRDSFGEASFVSDLEDGPDGPRRLSREEEEELVGSRRNSISAAPVTSERLADWKGAPYYEKSPDEAARIKETIQNGAALQVLFGHLSDADVDEVIGAMFAREVQAGEIVIEQGADGDFFYIVESGEYDIFVQRQGDVPPEKVMVAKAGASFGELALMHSVQRAATVTCVIPGKLWCLERDCFQMLLVTAKNSSATEYQGFLSQVDVLSILNNYELSRLGEMLSPELFDDGEEIVRQGEEGDCVFFLYDGECKAYMTGDSGEVEVKTYSTQGEYFGEIALITGEPRRATVRAGSGGCVVLKLTKDSVDLTLGNIHDRLIQSIEKYPSYEACVGGG